LNKKNSSPRRNPESGTTYVTHQDLLEIESAFAGIEVQGARYPAALAQRVCK